MKKICFLSFFVILFISIFSCRKDLDFDIATQKLKFSNDTIVLDSVFNTVRSETFLLKVKNTQNKDVVIPRIYLGSLQNSQYKINVDGTPGYDFHEIPIRSKDSLYIMIEISPKTNSGDFLAEENLNFVTSGNTQTVKLISLIKDADFFYSESNVNELISNTVWDSVKAKVIYGELKIPKNVKLIIEESTKIYFHKDSKLTVEGELEIKGSLGKEVYIAGDRLGERYESVAAYWEMIDFKSDSKANIDYVLIKGGKTAFMLNDNVDLNISNTKIFNFSQSGIKSVNSKIKAFNLVINNCGEADINAQGGGTYDFTHCTFANNWNLNFATAYSVFISNTYEGVKNNLKAEFKNCIFWSKERNSLELSEEGTYLFDTNLIKSIKALDNNFNPVNNIYNKEPMFKDLKYDFSLLEASPIINKANPTYSAQFPKDITGENRTVKPAIGAYNFK